MFNVNIIGSGFVGLTLTEVLSRLPKISTITVIDSDESKIEKLKRGVIHVSEKDLTLKSDKIKFSTDVRDCIGDIYFICVGTPNVGNTQNVDQVKKAIGDVLSNNKYATVIIKSTTLPEHVTKICNEFTEFSQRAVLISNPEFLAEGNSVHDLLNQSNLIIGSRPEMLGYATKLMCELFDGTFSAHTSVGLEEAMVIKYMINSYKAQKITFFNQFNNYCKLNGYSFKEVKEGVRSEPVMGVGFDNPGVGYGGSCFPKDVSAIGNYIQACKLISEMNDSAIESFKSGFPNIQGNVLLVGKSFKLGTNDTRESISVKVGEELSKLNRVYYYDYLPELSDLTFRDLIEMKGDFALVILFDNYPEVHDLFKSDFSGIYVNTRLIT